jgi:two-component system LytT family sensor kinase
MPAPISARPDPPIAARWPRRAAMPAATAGRWPIPPIRMRRRRQQEKGQPDVATNSAASTANVPASSRADNAATRPSESDTLSQPNLLRLRGRPFFEDKNRAFWTLQSVGWSGYFVLRTLTGLANAMAWSYVLHTLLLTAAGYSITLLMAAAFRRLIRMRELYTWAGSILIVVIASAALSAIETWSYSVFIQPGSPPEGIRFLGAIILTFLLLMAWSALYYSINFYLLLEEQADRLLRLESAASNAQLAMLRYQLNPHFLFNTLNSISTLVLLKQGDRANAMLSRLSSFLRYTLVNEASARVTLAQEIETLKLYLEIEKMRFEERLRPHFSVDPAAERALLPSLLLQPLIENAIKYAVTPQENGADIAVEVRRRANRVAITVVDTGPGADSGYQKRAAQSTGVGLANIRDRLAQAYGDNHRFETQTETTGGFRVFIEIPYQTEETEEPK